MKVKRQLETLQYKWPVKHAATTLREGALLMPGVTAETDLGVLILATSAGADVAGVLKKQFASTESDTLVNGTVWNLRDVEPIAPMYILEAEYDQSDTAAVASTSGTTVTVTSLEDNIDTSWLYGVSGTGAGGLYFVATSASGSCVTKTATGWDSTTTIIKILRLFHQVAKLNATADKIGTDAGAGSYTCVVLNNYLRSGGRVQYLDPTKNDAMSGLNTSYLASKFFAEIAVRNGTPYTTE